MMEPACKTTWSDSRSDFSLWVPKTEQIVVRGKIDVRFEVCEFPELPNLRTADNLRTSDRNDACSGQPVIYHAQAEATELHLTNSRTRPRTRPYKMKLFSENTQFVLSTPHNGGGYLPLFAEPHSPS